MPDVQKKMSDAPNYGPSSNPDYTCGNCIHGGPDFYCDLYKGTFKSGYKCSSWEPMEKRLEKHVPPAEVRANSRRGVNLYEKLPLDQRTMDPAKKDIMNGLANGRPMGPDELAAMHGHFAESPVHADRHVHLGLGGRAGRSWIRRVQRMNATDTASVGKFVEIRGTISKVDEEKHRVFGIASVSSVNGVPVTDLQGDIITDSEMEEAAYSFVLDCRVAGAMHVKIGVGRLIESMVFTDEKQKILGVNLGKVFWWCGFVIDDEKVWAHVKSGALSAFSIHGKGVRNKIEESTFSAA